MLPSWPRGTLCAKVCQRQLHVGFEYLRPSFFQRISSSEGEFIVSCNSGIWTVGTAGPRPSGADIGVPSQLSSTLSSFSGMDPFPYLFQQMYHACAILPWQRSSACPWSKWVLPGVLPKCPIQHLVLLEPLWVHHVSLLNAIDRRKDGKLVKRNGVGTMKV